MMRGWFVFILFAGVFSAMLSHGPSRRSSAPSAFDQEKAYQAKVLREGYAQPSDPNSQELTLQREGNGHFYADATINNVPIRVLVDTGATGIALSRDDARRAGLAVSSGMFEVVGEGASGDVRGEFVTLDNVSLGTASASSVPAVILDSGEQSLLGQDFLKQFDTVEIRGDTMVLR